MQAILHAICNLLPYHLVCYGALLGTQLFQSLVIPKTWDQSPFMCDDFALRGQLCPAYYQYQVGLAILTAVTRPPYGIFSLIEDIWSIIPLLIILFAATWNCLVFGPRTTSAAVDRRSLQERATDGKDTDAIDPAIFQPANRKPSADHATATRMNAISFIAALWYAFALSSSLLQSGGLD